MQAVAMPPDDALEALAKLAYSSLHEVAIDEIDEEWTALPRGVQLRFVQMVEAVSSERHLLDRIMH